MRAFMNPTASSGVAEYSRKRKKGNVISVSMDGCLLTNYNVELVKCKRLHAHTIPMPPWVSRKNEVSTERASHLLQALANRCSGWHP